MKHCNRDIPIFWKNNISAESNTGSYHTDGNTLYSYSKIIGVTYNHSKILFDYSGKNSISNTTSTHVGYARTIADDIVPPEKSSSFTKFSS
jgi:hypothetical protein